MRIAMVSEHASPLAVMGGEDAGGQNVHVAALTRHLAHAGHDVTVWTRRDDPALPERVVRDGVTVAHVDAGPPEPIAKDQLPRWMDDFADTLGDAWRFDPPDVIHSHFWMSGRAALHARPAATPVLHTFHALGVVKRRHLGGGDPSPLERLRVEEDIARTADRVIATCCDELRELHGMGADPERVDVVPCGVDLEHFHPDGPRDERTGRPRIVVVSRLVPRKGIDDVIRALAALPDTELVVAGGPQGGRLTADPEVRRLLAVARRCGVADRVQLRGALPRAEVAALLRSADVVACTPWYEPFGIVPLEAMASGVPVVASAVGGMLDSVVDGVTGLHVPPRDPLALAAALGRLLGNDGFRARLGRAGRQHAVDHFAWSTVAAGTLASYHAACGAPAAGRRRRVGAAMSAARAAGGGWPS
jgi:glycosyltransferase involved in cell wall biosynthesis